MKPLTAAILTVLGIIVISLAGAILFEYGLKNTDASDVRHIPKETPEEADRMIIFGEDGRTYIANSTLLLKLIELDCEARVEKDNSRIINVSWKLAPDNKTMTDFTCNGGR